MRIALGVVFLALATAGGANAGTDAFKTRCCFLVQATASGSFTEDFGSDPETNGFAGSLTHEWSWSWRDLYTYDETDGEPYLDNITGGGPRRLTRFKASYSVRARLWAYGYWHPACSFSSQSPTDGTGWTRSGGATESYTGNVEFARRQGRLALSVTSPYIESTNECPTPIGQATNTITDFFRPPLLTGPYVYEITPPKRSLFRKAKRFDAPLAANARCFDGVQICYEYIAYSGTTRVLVKFSFFPAATLQDWIRKLNRLPQ